MKKNLLAYMPLLILAVIALASCNPTTENEQELITTVKLTLTPTTGGADIILEFKDLDGDGGNAPTHTVSGPIEANKSYIGSLEILNETTSPADDIAAEVQTEGTAHQIFYQTSGVVDMVFIYTDTDTNGKPIGLMTQLASGNVGTGVLRIVLRHEPDKSAQNVSTGDLLNAGGETDFDVSFDITVQ